MKAKLKRKDAQKIRLLADCIDDPVLFGKEVIGVEEFEPYQERVLMALAEHRRVAWRAAHGVGKSFTAAIAVIWFVITRPYSKVITTASTWRQVEKVLWPEIKFWVKRAKFDKIGWIWEIEVLNTMLKIDDNWFATGESSDDPAKMEGFHAPYILYVVDEAKAVKEETFDAIEGALTSEFAYEFVISTPPLAPVGAFYKLFSKRPPGWKFFHTSALESKRVSKQWIEQKRKQWGEDNPVYISKVLGEFPDVSDDTLIPMYAIERAIGRDAPLCDIRRVACDVARFGGDETVIAYRLGWVIDFYYIKRIIDTMETAGRVIAASKIFKTTDVRIDVIGVGSGVVDRCREETGYNWGVNVAEASSSQETFVNKRAEWYWELRRVFLEEPVVIPDDDDLVAQLANIKYKYDGKGRIKIESKEEMKRRGLPSPDRADAVMMLFGVDEKKPEPRIRSLR